MIPRAELVCRLPMLLIALIAVLGLWQPRAARADGCKPDGEVCRSGQSCCGGVCVKDTSAFGTCCTPTT